LDVSVQEKFANLTCHRFENAGPGIARNRGASLANGNYLLFLDADDFLDAEFEANMLSAVQKKEDVILGGFQYLNIPRPRLPFFQNDQKIPSYLDVKEMGLADFRKACDFFAAGTCLLKRSVFEKTKGFFPDYKVLFGEDIFLWFQVLLVAESVFRIPEIVVWIDDAQSDLGISVRKNRPVSILAFCHSSQFYPVCKSKEPKFVNQFMKEYRLEAAFQLVREGRFREIRSLAGKFPNLLLSMPLLNFMIKRFLRYGTR
jgi:glycosyltransferase involved in cell wall biosynthesis